MINAGTDGTGQVQALVDRLPPEAPDNPTQPRMPFDTAYKLTRQQEDALLAHAFEKIEELEKSLGRVTQQYGTLGGRQIAVYDPYTWMGKREIFTARYYNHVDDRPFLHERPNIYEQSNLTGNLSQRITGQMIARANKYFFGEPDDEQWFSSQPIGVSDDPLADTIRKHGPWKARKCGLKPVMEQANEFAFVRGEAVVKITHQERFQIYKRNAVILVDDKGQPVLDAYGDYILQSDTFVDETMIVAPPQAPNVAIPQIGNTGQVPNSQQPATPGADGDDQGQGQVMPTGRKILKRDGVTVLPDNPIWVAQMITRKLVTFEGPEAQLVYFKDFLCAENAADIHTTDFICHLFDMTLMKVAQMFRGVYGEGDGALANFNEAIRRLREMAANSGEPKAAADQARYEFNENPVNGGTNRPSSEWAECHLTYDADNDGIEEEIMLLLDRQARAPIYYEYEANVTVRGRRPFEVNRAKAVDGRWWGMGSMEYLEKEQGVIDLEINRRNFADGGSGRVTLWRPYNTLEGDREPHLKLHHGGTYTPKPNMKDEDVLSYVVLPNEGKDFMELLNKFEQYAMLKSGTINGADQNASGLPTANTATGINEVADSGDELFAAFISCLYPCQFAILSQFLDVTYANLNRAEVFAIFNGQDAQEAVSILTLTPDDVRDLSLHVTFVLSRSAQRQVLQNGAQAEGIINNYYARPPALQERTTEYARRALKALMIPQPDHVIEPMPDTGPPAPPPPHLSLSMNFKDAPPPIRSQIETQFGMQPSDEPSPTDKPAEPPAPPNAAQNPPV